MPLVEKNDSENSETSYWPLVYVLLAISIAIFIFSDGLSHMLLDWERDEYSHGYIIPLISLFLLLQKLPALSAVKPTKQIVGLFIIAFGIFFYVLGELSALYTIIQYGFVIVLVGVTVSLLGIRGALVVSAPVLYLIFMIPLPNFLYFNLSSQLQLISSAIGVFILRLFDISVHLEGNIIDLGNLRLQVVDACSGLRYLFPLMSFGFLVAYIYRAPRWKKAIIFLSTIPITILMNSFRIAVIGVTVGFWGAAAAEGFLHDFEGWVIFLACLGLLAIEILILHRLSGLKTNPLDDLDISLPRPLFKANYISSFSKVSAPAVIALGILMLSVSLKFVITERSEAVPKRAEFNQLPLMIGSWVGTEGRVEQDVLDVLKLNDYVLNDYTDTDSGLTINLYIAYYESQRKGASVHSPKTCIPGGGWEMLEQTTVNFNEVVSTKGVPLTANRVLIKKDKNQSLVYYWFQQRGRIITNEYLAKWYIFWDALTRNRTDGALVRLVVGYTDADGKVNAEIKMQKFVEQLAPILPKYLPE